MNKILIVEDDEYSIDMLSRRLMRKGYDVIMAGDGEEGVALARQGQPDIILMDIGLPVISGWDATGRIKSMPETKHIPVIALTSHAMAGDREKALQAGFDEHETKPVDFERLLMKIRSILDNGAPQ
jgi:CheY-like chemotaxis protein